MTTRNLVRRGGRDVPASRETEPLLSLQSTINEIFEDFLGRPGMTPFGTFTSVWGERTPTVDVIDNAEEIRVEAELPGVDEKDVHVSLTENVLTISGEKKLEHKKKEEGQVYSERSFGTFQRSIPLSCEVLADKVDASFKKGVLTVRLPKSKEARERVRQIPVKS